MNAEQRNSSLGILGLHFHRPLTSPSKEINWNVKSCSKPTHSTCPLTGTQWAVVYFTTLKTPAVITGQHTELCTNKTTDIGSSESMRQVMYPRCHIMNKY